MSKEKTLTDEQKLLLYKLGDAITHDHIDKNALGDKAVAVSGLEWHKWQKKNEAGDVVDSGEKPKIGVQFPSLPKVFEYRIPAQTLAAMEEKVGSLADPKNIVGSSLQFVKKTTGFKWVDCIITATPAENNSSQTDVGSDSSKDSAPPVSEEEAAEVLEEEGQ